MLKLFYYAKLEERRPKPAPFLRERARGGEERTMTATERPILAGLGKLRAGISESAVWRSLLFLLSSLLLALYTDQTGFPLDTGLG